MQPWGERVPVGKDNLLLRECVIKNTDFVEGLVVYAGHESKVGLVELHNFSFGVRTFDARNAVNGTFHT